MRGAWNAGGAVAMGFVLIACIILALRGEVFAILWLGLFFVVWLIKK